MSSINFPVPNLNTSHVNLQPTKLRWFVLFWSNLNTSHVNLQQEMELSQRGLSVYLNTSHVNLQREGFSIL